MELIETDTDPQGKLLKHWQRLPQKVDLEFQELSYCIKTSDKNAGLKHILRSISGTILPGEITALLGPSGCGKTTLLNILAGYLSSGVKGTIKVNGKPRQMKTFRKMSSYIMQENLLQQLLSVRESLTIAANLKLGANLNEKDKMAIVAEVIQLLGLENCADTRTEHLSGGEEKRVSIALELISNPPVIFLDEPLSGLDSVSTKQCVTFLRKLADQGRTVICSVHQPPASLFGKFDQVYFMAEGSCVYNGTANNLVPFLNETNNVCPTTYNPADYIVELSYSEEAREVLRTAIENGKQNKRTLKTTACSHAAVYEETVQNLEANSSIEFPISCWNQFRIIICRMFLQAARNRIVIGFQIVHHISTGLFIGGLFFGIGKDAGQAIANFYLLNGVLMQCLFTQVTAPLLLYPTEVKMVQREYNNRWYSLKAYFMALCLKNLPSMAILSTTAVLIIYFMCDLPVDMHRIIWFSVVTLLVGIASESLGVTIGSVFNTTHSLVVGPLLVAPIIIMSIYGVGYGATIPWFYTFLMSLSFLRYGLVALCQALFNGKTYDWECNDLYCHYKDPKILLRDLGMIDASFYVQVMGIVAFIFVFRFLGYVALKYRLKPDFIFSGINHKQMI